MTYKEFDKVKLMNGETATIVEVLGNGKAFIVDIDKNGDWDTAFVYLDDIKCKME